MSSFQYLALLLGAVGGFYLGSALRPENRVAKALLAPPLLAVAGGIAGLALGGLIAPGVNFASPVVWAEAAVEIRSEEEFDKFVAETKGRALVDFYANWCGPCRMMAPAVSELAAEGHRIAVVNVDVNRPLAERFGISSIPAVFVVEDGRIVDQGIRGMHTKSALERLLRGN